MTSAKRVGSARGRTCEIPSEGLFTKGCDRDVPLGQRSTAQVYQARWGIFCGWCRRRSLNPLTASVPRIADFFVHLRQDKGMSVSSIKGYQSALNSVFVLKGQDLSSSRELSMLVRSFAVSCPPAEVRPPAWDLSLVLRSLKTAPYEPLASVLERFVGLKALFLLALASSKRVGELRGCLLYTSPSPRDGLLSRMPSSA